MSSLIITVEHVRVGPVRYGKYMRWHFRPTFAPVHVHHSWGVNRESFVRIDSDAKQARIRLRIQHFVRIVALISETEASKVGSKW